MSDLPACIHSPGGKGLCRACREEYRVDPWAYLDYGSHPEGLANRAALLDEIAADAAAHPETLAVPGDCPF